jgi:hypothetical protein
MELDWEGWMWISHTYPEVSACAYTLDMACEGGVNFMLSGSFSLFLNFSLLVIKKSLNV